MAVALSLAAIPGCVTRQAAAPAPGQTPAATFLPTPLLGRPFDVVAARSRLVVLVYRAGPLAALGHNHVISCRCLTGTVYVPGDPLRSSFDLRFAADRLTVDDPALRAGERSAQFPPDVPQSARQGTRHNMLSAALLNAAKYPEITLRSAGLQPARDGTHGDIIARVIVGIDGQRRSIAVPMHYEIRTDEIVAAGGFALKLTELGLTPFSAVGGALRVRDGMEVRVSLVARRRD